MPEKILVATPDPVFGEWLRSSLAENGGYAVHLAATGGEVLFAAAAEPFALALLDSDLPGEPFVPLARGLVALNPNLRLLVIPPDNDPHHPTLAGLVPHGYITRPCYLLELLDMIRSLLASRSRGVGQEGAPLMPASQGASWLEEPGQAAAQLARLLLETSAQAVLICAECKVWAQAGSLSAASAMELAPQACADWRAYPRTGMASFVRLSGERSEHLLYALPLLEDLSLALLYDPSTPLTRANRQSNMLAAALQAQAVGLPSAAEPAPAPAALAREELPRIDPAEMPAVIEDLPTTPLTQPEMEPVALDDLRLAADMAWMDADDQDEPEEAPQIDLAALLAGMPSPDPDGPAVFPAPQAGGDWLAEAQPDISAGPAQPVAEEREIAAPALPVSGEEGPSAVERLEAVGIGSTPALDEQETQADRLEAILAAGEAQPPAVEVEIPAWLVDDPSSVPPADSTRPSLPQDPATTVPSIGRDLWRPEAHPRPGNPPRALPTLSDLCYTCLLVPNSPEHHLTGELAARLSEWFPQFCLAFGWRLEGLVIRPEYVQWTVELDPNVSPGKVVSVLRQRTSQRIFERFPGLAVSAGSPPRKDFWAPGYLAVRGIQPPAAHVLRNFLYQTRMRQGYINY